MKNVYTYICKANQIIFFLVALVVVAMMGFKLIKTIITPPYTPPQVKVVDDQPSNQGLIEKAPYGVMFALKINDVFIFKLTRELIVRSTGDEGLKMFDAYSSGKSKGEYIDHEVVNFLFVYNEGENKKLFDDDMYITSYRFAEFEDNAMNATSARNEYRRYEIKLPINLYTVIASDTNNDGYFGENDHKSLYRSDYSGKSLHKISDNIQDYDVLDKNTLLLRLESDDYFEYKISEDSLTQIDTKINN